MAEVARIRRPAVVPPRLPRRPDGLDPHVAALVEALARDAARADHAAAIAAVSRKNIREPCGAPKF